MPSSLSPRGNVRRVGSRQGGGGFPGSQGNQKGGNFSVWTTQDFCFPIKWASLEQWYHQLSCMEGKQGLFIQRYVFILPHGLKKKHEMRMRRAQFNLESICIHQFTYHPSIHPSVHPSILLSICPTICPSVHPFIHPSIHPFVCQALC